MWWVSVSTTSLLGGRWQYRTEQRWHTYHAGHRKKHQAEWNRDAAGGGPDDPLRDDAEQADKEDQRLPRVPADLHG